MEDEKLYINAGLRWKAIIPVTFSFENQMDDLLFPF
jgi:hypothetical protein